MLYKSQPGHIVSPHQNYKVTFTTSTRPIQATLNTPMSRSHQGYHQPYLNNRQSNTPQQNYVNPDGKQYNSTNLNKQLNGSRMHGQLKDEGREQKINKESNSWLGNNWWKILLGLIIVGGMGFGAFMFLKSQNRNMEISDSYQVSNNMVEDGKENFSFTIPPSSNINQTSRITYINTLDIPSAPDSVKNKTQESKESSKITGKQEDNKKQKQQVKIQKKEQVNGTEKNEKIISNIMPPQSKTGTVWEQKIQVKYQPKTQNKTESKLEVKSEMMPQIKSQLKQQTKLEITPKTKPEAKPEQITSKTKPEVKPEAKSETKPENKPETKSEAKPEAKPETKAETKAETKPQRMPVTMPEYKNELKNQVKIEIRPTNGSFEVKSSETKTQNKPATKTQQAQNTNEQKPIPKIQIGPEKKAEEKLENKTEQTWEIEQKISAQQTIARPKKEQEVHPELRMSLQGEKKKATNLNIKKGEQITIEQATNAHVTDKQKPKMMVNEQKRVKNNSHRLRKYQ